MIVEEMLKEYIEKIELHKEENDKFEYLGIDLTESISNYKKEIFSFLKSNVLNRVVAVDDGFTFNKELIWEKSSMIGLLGRKEFLISELANYYQYKTSIADSLRNANSLVDVMKDLNTPGEFNSSFVNRYYAGEIK